MSVEKLSEVHVQIDFPFRSPQWKECKGSKTTISRFSRVRQREALASSARGGLMYVSRNGLPECTDISHLVVNTAGQGENVADLQKA